MRKFAVALVLASIAVAAPALADVPAPVAGPHAVALIWAPARIARAKDQIALLEKHVADLQPVLTHDTASRDSLRSDATTLEKAGKDGRALATNYRAMAAADTDKKNKEAFEHFAHELDEFSRLDDENAKSNREAARRLEEHVAHLTNVINWHTARATELKTALANNS